jgi:syntaxin 5
MNVEAGHGQLVQHMDRLSSNHWLILKIFAILIAFSVFFVMFVA